MLASGGSAELTVLASGGSAELTVLASGGSAELTVLASSGSDELTVQVEGVDEVSECVSRVSGPQVCLACRYLCCGASSGVGQSATQRGRTTALSGGPRRTAGAQRLCVQPAA